MMGVKVPPLPSLPRLEMPRLGLASWRRRLLVRGVFLLLVLATLALAVVLLKEEKERSLRTYAQGFRKTQAELAARLRHPAGQLALLNAGRAAPTHAVGPGLSPVLLPYGALDFDDQYKAQQAAETAGCSVQYPGGGALCVAVGSNPYAGGFIYLVGSFLAPPLVARERGELDLRAVHRARVRLHLRGEGQQWIAPFEVLPEPGAPQLRGRLTGFAQEDDAQLSPQARPVRDFRGWLWQGSRCADPALDTADCARHAFFSIRLPVEAYRQALFAKPRPAWPPADLGDTRVQLQMLGPDAIVLFDSDASGASAPFALEELAQALQPGEVLEIRRTGSAQPITLRGAAAEGGPTLPWLARLIGKLPVQGTDLPALVGQETIVTPAGDYAIRLVGDVRGIEAGLSVVATRMSWYVGAMLAAIALGWLIVEIGLLRRVSALTRRAAAVSYNVNAREVDQRLGALEVSDLRGRDELGILAGALADLLQRVKDDVRREHIRTEQERDMWHAVGHEIMSPLQSLMVLHPEAGDASHRYVQRMQQAVRVLYGQASPSEAIAAASLSVGTLDLDAFVRTVAANAPFAGVTGVVVAGGRGPVPVRADEFSLEDVLTHLLRNAERHRTAGTAITLSLQADAATVHLAVHNQGPQIAPDMLERIFEYGVSGEDEAAVDAAHAGQRGQGLFVARTYMAKMGGTIAAQNVQDGVRFVLTLQRAG